MALAREIYRELEEIVGAENVSDDEVILSSYAWRSGMSAGTDKFLPRAAAVVLPGDTAEVQKIVRLCNCIS